MTAAQTAFLYHATPLHYLPQILADGALFPKSIGAARGISPRASAARRDRMLGLADYVHLSTTSHTPLLADKLRRGYPHALLEFPRAATLALPGAALLPFNTKAWRDKASFAPVTGRDEQQALLRDHDLGLRSPSLEVLVPYGLGLETLTQIALIAPDEHTSVTALLTGLGMTAPAPLTLNPKLFPLRGLYRPVTREAVDGYFAACRAACTLLPPPEIAFD